MNGGGQPGESTGDSMARDSRLIHGSCVRIGTTGVILRGPSGSGKSDLALRLIDEGARLVADDQIRIHVRDGKILAHAPETIRGLIEVRGLGLARLAAERLAPEAVIGLLCDLDPGPHERLPEPETETLLGIAVARVRIDPFAASAPARLRLAVDRGFGTILSLS